MLKIPHPNDPVIDPMEHFPDGIRQVLKQKGTPQEFGPGDTVLKPGDNGESVRFILAGEISLIMREGEDQVIPVDTLKPGDIFGEISFITGSPSPSDVELIADERSQLITLDYENFEMMLRENPSFATLMVKNLARKIMRLDRTIFQSKKRKRALQSLISRQEHIFPDYVIGDYIRSHLASRVEELAMSEGPVLIIGETGVGKEVLAHTIFRMSHHYKGVFLLLDLLRTRHENYVNYEESGNGSAVKDLTVEQIKLFFGTEEPANEGVKITPGYTELTEDGTLLVRGVELLTTEMQAQLLDALTTGSFSRYGGTERNQVKLRLIATTELDASEITKEKHPLIHGLKTRSLTIPPLRKRRREIPGLVEHYITQYCQELRKDTGELPKETLKTLVNYSWPGNDVELSTTLKRAILVSQGGVIRPQDIYFDLKRVEGRGKFNLLRFNVVKQMLRSPLFPAVFQSAVTPFFFILLVLLFLGPADLMNNPAALFSWAVGWPIIIVGAFIWSRFWCSLCPIGTLSKLAKKIVALEKPFPQFLKNHSDVVIAAAVLGIIWFETATNIRHSPFNVGLLLLVMLISAVLTAIIYERQSWCRYLCGLGGMISVLAKSSPLELRADRNVCVSQCTSNECYLGNAQMEGCPFGQVAPKLHSNRFCKLCGICVKICPHGAVNLNLRVPGKEIWEMRHTNTGTAFLIIGMIGGLISEMISKMPIYSRLTADIPLPEIGKFSLVFFAILIIVNLLLALSASLSKNFFGDTFNENFSRYGLALLPITLTGFTAFHVYYLINWGVQLPILVSNTFQFEIFKQLIITVPPDVTHFIQKILLWIGLGWSLMIIYKLGRSSDESFGRAIIGILPHAILACLLTAALQTAITHFFYPVLTTL